MKNITISGPFEEIQALFNKAPTQTKKEAQSIIGWVQNMPVGLRRYGVFLSASRSDKVAPIKEIRESTRNGDEVMDLKDAKNFVENNITFF